MLHCAVSYHITGLDLYLKEFEHQISQHQDLAALASHFARIGLDPVFYAMGTNLT